MIVEVGNAYSFIIHNKEILPGPILINTDHIVSMYLEIKEYDNEEDYEKEDCWIITRMLDGSYLNRHFTSYDVAQKEMDRIKLIVHAKSFS